MDKAALAYFEKTTYVKVTPPLELYHNMLLYVVFQLVEGADSSESGGCPEREGESPGYHFNTRSK